MKLSSFLRLSSKTTNPQANPSVVYNLYSLPSFDDGRKCEVVHGSEIQSNKFIVPDKCILFNKLNVRFKRIWRIDNTEPNKIASTEFLPLVVDESIVDFHYCYYLLRSDRITDYLTGQNTNTSGSHKRIDPDNFFDIEVSLPSLEDQKRIGEVLSNLDMKIDINTSLNHYLEAMAKQLYDYWFVQFDFPDENGKPYKSSGGKMVLDEKLKRDIPEGWSAATLKDIANITMGQSPEGSSYNSIGEGVLFYQGSTDFGIRFPSVRQFTTAPKRFAKQGDILMSVRAPVGTLNIANRDCCIGRGLAALNSKIGSITHLYYLLSEFRVRFDNANATGTTFGSITKEELIDLSVLKPNEEVVKKFEKAASDFFDRQMVIEEEINLLQKQHDELLPLLMTGQVSVKQLNNDL